MKDNSFHCVLPQTVVIFQLKQLWTIIAIKYRTMLASTKKTLNSSTAVSKSSVIKKKESFFAFIFRKISQAIKNIYNFSRKCLWVSSTGLIVIVLPFAFAYFMEMQKELLKIQGGMNSGPQVY